MLAKIYALKVVEDLLEQGIIEESESDWCSPVLLVKKKDSQMKLGVDYRRVNRVLKRDEWPLPRIQEILDALGGSKFFSVLDLKSGFHQIGMAPESKNIYSLHHKKGPIYVQFYAIWDNIQSECIPQICSQDIPRHGLDTTNILCR